MQTIFLILLAIGVAVITGAAWYHTSSNKKEKKLMYKDPVYNKAPSRSTSSSSNSRSSVSSFLDDAIDSLPDFDFD